MPLPDERPRASVANLIGRFEQHNKRQSLTPVVPPRPPKEDPKDKPEWPPKSPDPPKHVLPKDVSPPSQQIVNLDEPEVARPASLSPSPPADKPSTPKPALSSVHPSTKSIPARSTPRSSNTPSAPLIKAQHTGQSTASNSSSTRRQATPRTAPSTPSRPKTPRTSSSVTSPPRAKTPSRPKTPSSTSRPKTPSSGLFAPTAASLARSRNAAPQPAPPIRKATLSSAATDRLSKPTAASLSKARAPASPPTRGSSSTRGTTATRGAKLKAATTVPSKARQLSAKASPIPTQQANDQSNDHEHVSSVDDLSEDEKQGVETHEELVITSEVDSDSGDLPLSSFSESHTSLVHAEEDDRNGETTPVAERFSDAPLTVVSDSSDNKPDTQSNTAPHAEADDIEDIVNLLESARARPVSIISIPDEVNEIPDEE